MSLHEFMSWRFPRKPLPIAQQSGDILYVQNNGVES